MAVMSWPAKLSAGPFRHAPVPGTARQQEIDAIIVAVPITGTSRWWSTPWQRGRTCTAKKPFSHSAADGLALCPGQPERSHRAGRAQRTSSVLCAKARELYQSGAIGKLSLVEATLGGRSHRRVGISAAPGLSPENLDWDTWLGTAPQETV